MEKQVHTTVTIGKNSLVQIFYREKSPGNTMKQRSIEKPSSRSRRESTTLLARSPIIPHSLISLLSLQFFSLPISYHHFTDLHVTEPIPYPDLPPAHLSLVPSFNVFFLSSS